MGIWCVRVKCSYPCPCPCPCPSRWRQRGSSFGLPDQAKTKHSQSQLVTGLQAYRLQNKHDFAKTWHLEINKRRPAKVGRTCNRATCALFLFFRNGKPLPSTYCTMQYQRSPITIFPVFTRFIPSNFTIPS